MEETKDSNPVLLRLYCENESCIKPRKHFCSDHSQVLCNGCFTALHARCKCDEIPDFRDIKECLDIVKTLFSSVRKKNSESLKADYYIKGFSDELKIFDEMLTKLDEKLISSINNDKFFEFNSIIKEVIQLQGKFVDSNSFTEFTKLKELKAIATGDSFSSQTAGKHGAKESSEELAKFKEQVLKEMEEHNKAKVEQRAKEMSQQTINDCKETIIQLEDKIKKEEEINKQLSDKNIVITKELETQRKKIEDMLEEQRRREEIEEQRDRTDRFSEIYEKHIISKIADLLNFDFEISLSDEKQKALMEDIVISKLSLPDIKRIQICDISDSNADLADSFLNWTPNRLKDLYISHFCILEVPINYKLDKNSLSKAVSTVTREVYISYFEFSATDLQQLIRAACNAERIVFCFCSVHCSSALDFGATIEYKTNYLSFDSCGVISSEELTTNWISDPSCFSHIVDAIGSSGLKHSLFKLNIYENQTLKKQKVQELLNAKGMTHIKVVEEDSDPSTD